MSKNRRWSKTVCNGHERIAKFELMEILPYISLGKRVDKIYAGKKVKMHLIKLRLFAKKGTKCAKCGLQGKFFALERQKSNIQDNGKYHLNLYGTNEEGEEIMMTRDHIVPKSKGGKSKFSNYQVLCERCNNFKGNKMPRQEIVKVERRKQYDKRKKQKR